MTPFLDFKEDNGLVHCSNPTGVKNHAERLYLNEAEKLGVTAVFFRRFYHNENNSKPKDNISPYHSEPVVCIFEKSDDRFFNSQEHKELHAALWSAGKNEIYVIIGQTRLDIINSRRPAVVDENKELNMEDLRLASSAIDAFNDLRFSAYLFESGTFWEQPDFEDKLDENSSPYIFLLDYLLAVRQMFLKTTTIKLSPGTIDKLLVTCILIKFLEDIKDDKGKHTLRIIYKQNKINSFAEALDKGLCLNILNELAGEFNGKIFDRFTLEEKQTIEKTNLGLLASFLRADINLRTNQLFIWKQYSFKHLPAEVISAIYENFIQAEAVRQNGDTEKGVVYTPIHLVNLLVDEVMPLNRPDLFKEEQFRILDPACGSGVFLVAAFKRLLQWWAINNSTPDNIKYPQCKKAQQILENNIFGVDVKETATLISIFGLTTALLDKLTPQEIWNNLKFNDLSLKNIQYDNFFEWAIKAKQQKLSFNLVIGNPPFNVESGKNKNEVLRPEVLEQLNLRHKIPNNNFALYFFEGSMLFTNKVCLIIPANVLLYNKAAQKYRNLIFTNYNVTKIFDFTHLRRDLFHKSADTPVVAMVAENMGSLKNPIEHTVVKRMISSEKKLRFEIDYYDRHSVLWDWAISDSKAFVWKTNLLGGGRLFHFIYRLSLLRSFERFIKDMKKLNPDWTYSVGYKLNGDDKKKNIEYIFGKESINTETFDENEEFTTFIEENRDFAEPRNQKIYEPPHVIFKVNIGKVNIPIHYSEKHLCFKDKLVGIHAPESEKGILKKIYNRFKETGYYRISKLWILATSPETLVNLETACKKDDIDSLPFPEDQTYLTLSSAEEIITEDLLKYYIHLGKSISKGNAGSFLHERVSPEQVKIFTNIFCEELNLVYAKKEKSWQPGFVYQGPFYTICQVGFGKNNSLRPSNLSELDNPTKHLIEDELSNSGTLYTRIVRIYQHINGFDCIFLVKPHTQRYWLNSIALRDADDTFMELKKEGF